MPAPSLAPVTCSQRLQSAAPCCQCGPSHESPERRQELPVVQEAALWEIFLFLEGQGIPNRKQKRIGLASFRCTVPAWSEVLQLTFAISTHLFCAYLLLQKLYTPVQHIKRKEVEHINQGTCLPQEHRTFWDF